MRKLLTILIFFTLMADLLSQPISYSEHKEDRLQDTYYYQAGYSPFMNYFAYTSGNCQLHLFNRDKEKIFETKSNPENLQGKFVFSPDETYLIFTKYKSKNDIAVYDLQEKLVVQTLLKHKYQVADLVYAPDGSYFLSAGDDKTINRWVLKNGAFMLAQSIEAHDRQITRLAINNDGTYAVSISSDKTAKIWSINKNGLSLHQTLDGFNLYLRDICFHPEKDYLYIASSEKIFIYEFKGDKYSLKDELNGYKAIYDLEFSPKGEVLVVTDRNTIHILEIENNGELKEKNSIYRHTETVFMLSFSPDGKFLLSTAVDKLMLTWRFEGLEPNNSFLIADYLAGKPSLAMKKMFLHIDQERLLKKIDPSLSAPKDEFETTMEYNERKQKLYHQVLSLLQDKLIEYYKLDVAGDGSYVKLPLDRLIAYNADLEIYKIEFLNTTAGVSIPVEKAKTLKTNANNAYIKAYRTFKKSGYGLDYYKFELYYPKVNEHYKVLSTENPFSTSDQTSKEGARSEYLQETNVKKSAINEKNETAEVGKSYALIIGTNIYDSFGELINPLLDAETIAEELKVNYGFSVNLIKNPTLDELVSNMRKFAQRSYSPNDLLVIFIAGHGMYDDIFKEGYVISKDSRSNDESKTTYLSHSNLRTIVNNIPCNHILLILDVCFGGTFDPVLASTSRAADMYADIDPGQYVERKLKYKSRYYLTSGGKEYVPDGRPGHHSPFARRVLEALRSFGGSDKMLTLNEMLLYIDKVDPQPYFGEFGDNEPGSDFIFIAN